MSTSHPCHAETRVGRFVVADCTVPLLGSPTDVVVLRGVDCEIWLDKHQAIELAEEITRMAYGQIARIAPVNPEAAAIGAAFDPASLEQGDAS